MANYSDLMKVLDEGENVTLYKLENDLFDTAVVVYNEDEDNEEIYVLTDMQGAYPKKIEEIAEYDWVKAEEVDW